MNIRTILAAATATTAAIATIVPVLADDPTYSGTSIKTLTSTLVDTTGARIGTVQLHQDAAGVVLVRIDAAGLPAGAHGIHIHAVGKCEGPAFTSAGGHFNPGGHQHGLANPSGPHAGDLAQIPPEFPGTGTHRATTDRISLTTGPTWIEDGDGSALIVHASADDQVTDPTGNSGARIACAVLAAPQPGSATPPPAATPTTAAPLPPSTGTGMSPADDGLATSWKLLVAAAFAVLGGAALLHRR